MDTHASNAPRLIRQRFKWSLNHHLRIPLLTLGAGWPAQLVQLKFAWVPAGNFIWDPQHDDNNHDDDDDDGDGDDDGDEICNDDDDDNNDDEDDDNGEEFQLGRQLVGDDDNGELSLNVGSNWETSVDSINLIPCVSFGSTSVLFGSTSVPIWETSVDN